MDSRKTLDSKFEYTIGWIAALAIETAAAKAMLDERHNLPADFSQPSNDTNSYTCGSVGEHNIVIATLPEGIHGNTSGLATGMPMLFAFPNIKFGLLVGIGAGIPNESNDVRLGDVVISRPEGKLGGVFQYDFGKAKSNGWERTGSLASPPQVLLKALTNMHSEHEMSASSMSKLLEAGINRYPKLARNYTHPGAALDRLFKASYDHQPGARTCADCDATMVIDRAKRHSTDPEIHYGLIACGNSVVKDSKVRDQIVAMEPECICLQMEAAGLMNNFPCIVIRGICGT